jgi:hypothetical protein
MDQILFFVVLPLAYLAANLFVKHDNKRIETECKLTKQSDSTDKLRRSPNYLRGDWGWLKALRCEKISSRE